MYCNESDFKEIKKGQNSANYAKLNYEEPQQANKTRNKEIIHVASLDFRTPGKINVERLISLKVGLFIVILEC